MRSLTSSASRRAKQLVCLDLVANERAEGQEAQTRVGRCRRLLAYARASGWAVCHVYPRVTGRHPKPLPGLEPLPSEPLYYRTGASAFSNSGFTRSLAEAYEVELVLLSLTLSSACLGTALAAHDRHIDIILVGDTISADADSMEGLGAIETVAQALVDPFVRIRDVDDLIDQRRGLRLVTA